MMTVSVRSQQDGICDKTSAPSVSSISRLLRGGRRDDCDPRRNHSIDGILGESQQRNYIGESFVITCFLSKSFYVGSSRDRTLCFTEASSCSKRAG